MEKCPKCSSQYDPGQGICPVCAGEEAPVRDYEADWVELTTVANDIEYELVAGLLEMGGIPVIRKVRGVDGYLQIVLGVPIGGIAMMVPKDKYEEALQVLNTEISEDEFLEEDEKPSEDTK